MPKRIMAGICPNCGRLLTRPVPADTAVCSCIGNPKPVLVKLRLMYDAGEVQKTEHPTFRFEIAK